MTGLEIISLIGVIVQSVIIPIGGAIYMLYRGQVKDEAQRQRADTIVLAIQQMGKTNEWTNDHMKTQAMRLLGAAYPKLDEAEREILIEAAVAATKAGVDLATR